MAQTSGSHLLLVQVSVCDADRLADMIRSDSELLHFGCQLGRICGGTGLFSCQWRVGHGDPGAGHAADWCQDFGSAPMTRCVAARKCCR